MNPIKHHLQCTLFNCNILDRIWENVYSICYYLTGYLVEILMNGLLVWQIKSILVTNTFLIFLKKFINLLIFKNWLLICYQNIVVQNEKCFVSSNFFIALKNKLFTLQKELKIQYKIVMKQQTTLYTHKYWLFYNTNLWY